MAKPHDPVTSARAKIAYWCRKDVGDPTKVPAARRELAMAKLERHITEVLEEHNPLTPSERARLVTLLLATVVATAA